MLFKQFVREDTGCVSFLLGSSATGEALVVDPGWDIAPYLQYTTTRGLRITRVVDTHLHGDHVSGNRRLAGRTGARVLLYHAAEVQFPFWPLADGDLIEMGEVHVRVMHAPGHRPENLALLVSDTARAGAPWLVLTGDSLCIGDVALPDPGIDTVEAAGALFDTLNGRLFHLDDGVEVFPTHIAGSSCGRVTSSITASTIGFERRFNLAATAGTRPAFVASLTARQPQCPPNLPVILAKNRGELEQREPARVPLPPVRVQEIFAAGAVLLDVRPPETYSRGYLPESLNVPLLSPEFSTSAAWSVPPEEPIVLVLEAPGDLDEAVAALAAIGLDWIEGYLEGGVDAWRQQGLPLLTTEMIAPRELADSIGERELAVLDVRSEVEWHLGHVPGAVHIAFPELSRRLSELDPARPLVVACASGYVSNVAVGMLRERGFTRVYNLAGGMRAWDQAGLARSDA